MYAIGTASVRARRGYLPLFHVVLLALAVHGQSALAIPAELVVDVPVLPVAVQSDAQGKAVFDCPAAVWLSRAGEPGVPWQTLSILLPPDVQSETVAVRLDGLVTEVMAGQWDVAPVGPEATWSGGREVVVWPTGSVIVDGKDTAVYGKAAFWPDTDVHLLTTGRLRKWRLAQVAVPLVKYDPVGRALQKMTAAKVMVSFEQAGAAKLMTSPQLQAELSDRIGEETVGRIAVNYQQQSAEYAASVTGDKAAPMFNGAVTPRYAIITTSAIQTASTKLASFVTHKQSQGFDVSVVAESGFGGGTGDAAAENIRNWLKNHYVSDNIEYVLLVGDPRPTTGAVPMKMLYPRSTSEAVPSDLYYADLTGNWNLDGDAYFGEYTGDMGTGGIDRFWEVVVGRIPYYGTIADLDYILQKIMDYQDQPSSSVAWRRSAILPMRDPDDWTGAFWLGEQIKNDTLSPAGWTWNRVYQAGTPVTPPAETTPCTMTNVTNAWKNGAFGLMLWWTHGSATSALDVMDTTYAAQLNDNHPSFTFQCSCNNASPETTNNLCYTLLKKGAVCTVGDSRTSWYDQGQSSFNGSASNAGLAYEYASRVVMDNMTPGHAIFDVTMVLTPTTAQKWMNFCDFAIYGDPDTYLLPRCGRRYVNANAAPGGDGTSWPTAYQDVQKALDDRAMEIWVAAGTYKPDRGTGSRSVSFRLEQKTAIYGGFAGGETSLTQRNPAVNVTILSGDLAGNDGPNFANNAENSYNVVVSRGCDSTSILDGLTVAGGNASNASSGVQDRGAGLHNYSCSSPAISHCIFTSNRSKYDGGAMYNSYGGSSPTVVNCTFNGNYAEGSGGAVSAGTGSQARFANCTFTANSGNYGGAVNGSSDYSAFTGCAFTGNIGRNGGGAIHDNTGSPTLVNCRFLGNTANTKGGALYFEQGSPTVVNCLLSGNTANGSGGAIQNDFSATPKFINCTIVGNVCTSIYAPGGGLYAYSASPAITNCIFWGNRDKDGYTETAQIYKDPGTVTINYSCVQSWSGSMGGTGNNGADPLLADPDGADNVVGTDDDNLRLFPASPCIDAGNNAIVPADTLDLDGDGNVTEPVPFDLDGLTRFADDTAVADTGSGTPPIVDWGVYEGARQAFVLSTQSLIVSEGGTASFTVSLAMNPGETVNVMVAPDPGNAHITVQSGASLVFNSGNYLVPQAVVLQSAEDVDNLSETAMIRVWAAGIVSAGVSATEADNEPVSDVLYVDADAPGVNNGSSWAAAYTDLQTALGMAAAHANVYEIRVAEGTYRPAGPSGNRGASFQLRNGLALKGGSAGYGQPSPDARDFNAHETILSGDLSANDGPGFANNGENSYHVVAAVNSDSTAILDGFTITAGNANDDGPTGGGMRTQNASPTITNCTFRANTASTGAGLYCYQGGTPTVTSCRFIGNAATTSGSGMYCAQAVASVNSCFFLANTASSSGGGLGISMGEASRVVNCVFSGNTANSGAGIYISQSSPAVINCTIIGNSSGNSGTGMWCDWMSSIQVSNCILWGNTRSGVADQGAQVVGTPAINYSCVQGWTGSLGGTGNHDNDPLFVDADGPDNVVGTIDDNLWLSNGSPCIDAGDNYALPSEITTDLGGYPRFVDDPGIADTGSGEPPIVDLGAYEGGPPAFLLSPRSVTVPEGGTASFTVSLANDPGGTLVVSVSRASGDPDISVQSGASLTFNSSDYTVPKTVTLAAGEDVDNLDGTAVIQISASGLTSGSVMATEGDNDPVADILYVDADAAGVNNGASWAQAYTDLKTAMVLASAHSNVSEIRVAEGVYKPAGPSGNRGASFQLRNGLALRGGFAGYGTPNPGARSVSHYETILSGDLNGNDGPNFADNSENSYHVVIADDVDASSTLLDGFTIIAGNAEGSTGGGMRSLFGAPTVVGCTFLANSADSGGGLYVEYSYGQVIRDCRFLGNSVGGDGGGLTLRSLNGNPELFNCLFSGNSAGSGAGVYVDSADAILANCTFVSNLAGSSGGGLYSNSSTRVTNCIFWGNTANESMDEYAQVNGVEINYSCVDGWSGDMGGNGNHGGDPLFVNAAGADGLTGTRDDNPRLQSGSPCIDAGDNGAVPSGIVTDLGGSPRFVDDPAVDDTGIGTPPIVDMGAYEKRLAGPPTDFDGDGDVDGDDADLFEDCASGPGIPLASGCENRDFDEDTDVDQLDFAVFQGCVSGAGVPADLDCAD